MESCVRLIPRGAEKVNYEAAHARGQPPVRTTCFPPIVLEWPLDLMVEVGFETVTLTVSRQCNRQWAATALAHFPPHLLPAQLSGPCVPLVVEITMWWRRSLGLHELEGQASVRAIRRDGLIRRRLRFSTRRLLSCRIPRHCPFEECRSAQDEACRPSPRVCWLSPLLDFESWARRRKAPKVTIEAKAQRSRNDSQQCAIGRHKHPSD